MADLTLAAMLGDGIGQDIVPAAMRVLTTAARRQGIDLDFAVLPCGLAALATHGSTFPAETRDALPEYPGWLLGPISQHLYPASDPRYINPSGFLRKHHDLYANIRPTRTSQRLRQCRCWSSR